MFDSVMAMARCSWAPVLLLITSCGTAPAIEPAAPGAATLANTSWSVVLMDNRFAEGLRPTLNFHGDDAARGDAGCNLYLGSVQMTGNAIQFAGMRQMAPANRRARKDCVSRYKDQESRFLAALGAVRSFRTQSGKLLLLDATNTARLLLELNGLSGGPPSRVATVVATPFIPDRPSQSGDYASRSDAGTEGPASPPAFAANDPLAGLELAPVTPALGRYFGTDRGVLVTRVLALNDFALQEGDVILSINDRQPANGPHVLRILSSYSAGDTLQLQVMRLRELVSVEVTLHR